MKLKLSNILNLSAALNALEGRDRVVRENNTDKVVREPYKIDSDALLAIVINMNTLDPLVRAYQRARNVLVREFADEKGVVNAASPKGMEFSKKEEALLDADEDVKLRKIKVTALALDKNSIPPGVLAGLFPILKYEDTGLGEAE